MNESITLGLSRALLDFKKFVNFANIRYYKTANKIAELKNLSKNYHFSLYKLSHA